MRVNIVINPREGPSSCVQSSKHQAILGEEIGHVRLMTLNQPRRLNAVSSDMLHLMAAFLEEWEKDEDAQLIIIKGSGRAFSGGGDLKSFYEGRTLKDRALGIPYRMYWLSYHIHTYKKTQVALVDGIAMGGGASIMGSMKFSVVTENAVFAVPETAIGFHPDCGFSYMLSRLPGHLGEFLGLTGTRLNGREIVAAGLATHFVPSEKLMELHNRLISLNTSEVTALRSAIEEFSVDVQIDEESVLNKRTIIDKCFSKDSMEEIVASCETEASKEGNGWIVPLLKGLKKFSPTSLKISGNGWIVPLLKGLKKFSPTSLKISLQSIREGRKQTLAECLKKEFRISANIMRTVISSDMYEGIRAALLDKDNAPKWDPRTLEAVEAEKVNLVFKPFEEDLELKIPESEQSRWGGKYEDSPYARKIIHESRL